LGLRVFFGLLAEALGQFFLLYGLFVPENLPQVIDRKVDDDRLLFDRLGANARQDRPARRSIILSHFIMKPTFLR